MNYCSKTISVLIILFTLVNCVAAEFAYIGHTIGGILGLVREIV